MYTRELAYLHYMNYGYHSALLKREIFYSVLKSIKFTKMIIKTTHLRQFLSNHSLCSKTANTMNFCTCYKPDLQYDLVRNKLCKLVGYRSIKHYNNKIIYEIWITLYNYLVHPFSFWFLALLAATSQPAHHFARLGIQNMLS